MIIKNDKIVDIKSNNTIIRIECGKYFNLKFFQKERRKKMLLSKGLQIFKRRKKRLIRTRMIVIATFFMIYPLLGWLYSSQKISLSLKLIIFFCLIPYILLLGNRVYTVSEDFESIVFLLDKMKYRKIICKAWEYTWINEGGINFEDIDGKKIFFDERKFTINFCEILIKSIEKEKNGFKRKNTKKQRIMGLAAIMTVSLIKNPIIKEENEIFEIIISLTTGEERRNNKTNNILIKEVIYEFFRYYPNNIDMRKLDVIDWSKVLIKIKKYKHIDEKVTYLYELFEKIL